MSEVRVLIVDDEPLARRSLRVLLEQHPDMHVIGECQDGRGATAVLHDGAVDLLFLDIQMPELDGFGVIREIGAPRMPATVFVTAFDEFAVRAFEVQALDYLVKPFTDERFEIMLARAREHLRRRDLREVAARLAGLLEQEGRARTGPGARGERTACATARPTAPPIAHATTYAKRLLVTTANRSQVIHVSAIDWVQADDYYAALHVGGRRHLLRETMSALEARLDPETFLRIHRSAIVNIERVHGLERTADGQLVVVLGNGARLPVSRSRRDAVEVALGRRGA
ncbi:MAG TPA: LytTR family DNA-binding domain-containing protein [Gemmatimonadaceae bacterium]